MTKFNRVLSESTPLTMVHKEEIPGGYSIEWLDGTVEFYDKSGHYHRDDGGPSISDSNGNSMWHHHGKLHRIGGPARVLHSGAVEEYWVNGNRLSKKEYDKHFDNPKESINEIKINKDMEWELHGAYGVQTVKKLVGGGHKVTKDYLTLFLDKNGELHREDGPAYINRGSKYKKWYMHGKLHRTDGPAIVDEYNKTEEYWVNGKRFFKDNYYKHFGDKSKKLVTL